VFVSNWVWESSDISIANLSVYLTDYISDGIFGSFHALAIHRAIPMPRLLRHNDRYILNAEATAKLPLYASTIWGPTHDAMDVVHSKVYLPELNIGDWLVYENMGVYTLATASTL
jgi:diaminopimelate decarboxylase